VTPAGMLLNTLAGLTAAGYNEAVRKHLRRLERVWLQDPIYFVTTCTYRRNAILASEHVAKILIHEWSSARERHGWTIGRYVIMPDHVHFFCAPELDAKPLSNLIGFWKEWMSKGIKRLMKLPSPVWQEEFFDHVLRSSESYSEKWNYVRNIRYDMVLSPTPMSGLGKVKSKNCVCSRRR